MHEGTHEGSEGRLKYTSQCVFEAYTSVPLVDYDVTYCPSGCCDLHILQYPNAQLEWPPTQWDEV